MSVGFLLPIENSKYSREESYIHTAHKSKPQIKWLLTQCELDPIVHESDYELKETVSVEGKPRSTRKERSVSPGV